MNRSILATLTSSGSQSSTILNFKLSSFLSPVSLLVLLLTSQLAFAFDSATESEKRDVKVKPEYIFQPTDNPSLEVKNALKQAKIENKYALIVLGAQWCHDSVGFAESLSAEKMEAILSERFITQFVDVAYLEDRRDVTRLLAYPNYFATPTVLIVDPTNNRLVNIDSITTWQNASSVVFTDYLAHFASWDPKNIGTAEDATYKQPALAALAAFETKQSARLQKAYDKLGPLLENDENARQSPKPADDATKKQGQAFIKLWRDVKKFRTQIQTDIHQLRKSSLNEAELNKKIEKINLKQQTWES